MTLSQFCLSNHNRSGFILLTGKRKVGKTTLMTEHLKRHKGAYITVSLKASTMQLADIADYLRSFGFTDQFIPSFQSWKELFDFMFFVARTKQVNLVIDEFQNLEFIEDNLLQVFRQSWAENCNSSSLIVTAITQDADFIQRIFNDEKGALNGINDLTLKLSPFGLHEVIKIFRLNSSYLPVKDIMEIYSIFGGLPKYYFLIDQFGLWNEQVNGILKELVLRQYAPLGFELKEILVNEFARGNKIYLSVLQAIATGSHTMTDIAKAVNIPVTSVTKYLYDLEKKRNLIKRKLPIGVADEAKSKQGRYYINNYFENFWFRFMQRDIISYEMGQFEKMTTAIAKDLPGYVDIRMENIVREIFRTHPNAAPVQRVFAHQIKKIGSLWTRKDTVEIVLVNEEKSVVLFGKLALQNHTIDLATAEKIYDIFASLQNPYPTFTSKYLVIVKSLLSDDASAFLKEKRIDILGMHELTDMLQIESEKDMTKPATTQRIRRPLSVVQKPRQREKI